MLLQMRVQFDVELNTRYAGLDTNYLKLDNNFQSLSESYHKLNENNNDILAALKKSKLSYDSGKKQILGIHVGNIKNANFGIMSGGIAVERANDKESVDYASQIVTALIQRGWRNLDIINDLNTNCFDVITYEQLPTGTFAIIVCPESNVDH